MLNQQSPSGAWESAFSLGILQRSDLLSCPLLIFSLHRLLEFLPSMQLRLCLFASEILFCFFLRHLTLSCVSGSFSITSNCRLFLHVSDYCKHTQTTHTIIYISVPSLMIISLLSCFSLSVLRNSICDSFFKTKFKAHLFHTPLGGCSPSPDSLL